MAIKNYGFDVTTVLKSLGKPRGDVFLGTELEFEVKSSLPKSNQPSSRELEEDENLIPLTELEECGCEENCQPILRRRAEAILSPTIEPPVIVEPPKIANWNDLVKDIEEVCKDFALLKSDNSLSNGFEIVTCPASLSVHKNRWEKFFKSDGIKFLEAKPTCGMHVHVSKKPLTPEMRANIHVFVNHPDHKEFIEKIAGRKSNTYTTFIPKPKAEVEFPKARYEAINLLPKNTMEFRIFASTTNFKVLCKNLEFVGALVHWVQTQKIDGDPTKLEFLAGVDRQRKMYPALVEFLESEKEI